MLAKPKSGDLVAKSNPAELPPALSAAELPPALSAAELPPALSAAELPPPLHTTVPLQIRPKAHNTLYELNLSCLLATKDWAHEWLLSLCMVLSLSSVLVPLLVIAGVKYGVITTLTDKLNQDPTILSLTPTGSGQYTKAWLAELSQRSDISFGIVRTRDIAATMQLVFKTPEQTQRLRVSLEPTAHGDPLVNFKLDHADSLVLSASVARKLGVRAGDIVLGQLGRKLPSGQLESVDLQLEVAHILPLTKEDRDIAFVSLDLLEDAENYRDYIAVESRGFAGEPKQEQTFASFRVYAKDLYAVAGLRDFFIQQGIEVYTKVQEIALVQNLDKSLTIIFALVGITVSLGALASLASNVLAAVRRKDKQLGMLRLLGFSSLSIRLFPVMQTVLTGIAAWALAGVIYLGLSAGLNILFGYLSGGDVCVLPWSYYLLTLLGVVTLSVLASAQAARYVAKIDPSDVLREM